MTYYHVSIKKSNTSEWIFLYDLSKKQLEDDILTPFKKQESFMCGVSVIRFAEIDAFGINETQLSSSEILKKTKRKRLFEKLFNSQQYEGIYIIDAQAIVSSGRDVTNELLKGFNIPEKNSTKLDSMTFVDSQIPSKPIVTEEQTEHARSLLYQLENSLRQFVSLKIKENNGKIDDSFINDWKNSKKKEFLKPRKPLETEIINYSSFDQLRRIITQNENWDKIFKNYFGRPNGIISRINEIDEIRDTIAHNRRLSDFDYKSFITFYNELMGCIETDSLREVAPLDEATTELFPREFRHQEEIHGIVLLPDGDDITKLQITNDMLNDFYEKAYKKAKEKYPDAKLLIFAIHVFPFGRISKVDIMLMFFSKGTDRIARFHFTDENPEVNYVLPDKFRNPSEDRNVFSSLPWKKSPNWLQVLRGIYSRIGQFAPANQTNYSFSVFPQSKEGHDWIFNFEDGFSGKTYNYYWSGKNKDEPQIRN